MNQKSMSFKEAIEHGEYAEDQLRLALSLTTLGLWEWSLEKDEVILSDEIFEITGLDKSAFDGTMTYVVGKIIHPEERLNFMKSMALARKEGIIRNRTYRVNHPHKDQCWVKFFTKVIRNDAGQPVKLMGTLLEITDDHLTKTSLKNNLDFMESIVETLPTPIYYKDDKGLYKFCNKAFTTFVGQEKEEVIGKDMRTLVTEEYLKTYKYADEELIRTKDAQSYEGKVLHSDGSIHSVLFSRAAHLDKKGHVHGIVGIMQDITNQKSIEREVKMLYKAKDVFLNANRNMMSYRSEKEFFDSIQKELQDVFDKATQSTVLQLDKQDVMSILINEGYDEKETQTFNMPLKESFVWKDSDGNLEQSHIIRDVSRYTRGAHQKIVATENGQDIHSSLVIPLRIEGKLRWILCIDSSVEEAYDEVDQFVADYICEELPIVYRMFELYQKTLMLSRYDGLTGLMNRRYFEYVFEEKINRAFYGKKALIVGLFDLDGLKKINDNYGHHAGDAYIKAFVNILKQSYSGADMLARIGGDEFTGLFEDDSLEALSEKFEQIRKTFENTEISCEGATFKGSFSYGFAIYPDDSKEMSHLLQLADENMYKDKQRHS